MEISLQFLALIPIIVGLVQAIKMAFSLKAQFIPLLAVLLGLLGAYFLGGFDTTSALQGIIAGLSSVGLYSGVRATRAK